MFQICLQTSNKKKRNFIFLISVKWKLEMNSSGGVFAPCDYVFVLLDHL